MQNVINSMRKIIINDFQKHWELNDGGHRIGHFAQVEECGVYINDQLGGVYDPYLIMLVAYFHDLFAWSRENHHMLSYHWVLSTDYSIIAGLSKEERNLVAEACRTHRASYKGTFPNGFSELMSAADRGFPETDVEKLLVRPIRYRLDRGASLEEARVGAIAHMKEKYASEGYVRYPEVYLKVFGEQLELQRKVINEM